MRRAPDAMAAEEMRRFGVEPKAALLSHSNFGTSDRPSAVKMRRTLAPIFASELAAGTITYGLSFLVNLGVSFMAAYLAAHALGTAPHYLAVFRVVGTVRLMLPLTVGVPPGSVTRRSTSRPPLRSASVCSKSPQSPVPATSS